MVEGAGVVRSSFHLADRRSRSADESKVVRWSPKGLLDGYRQMLESRGARFHPGAVSPQVKESFAAPAMAVVGSCPDASHGNGNVAGAGDEMASLPSVREGADIPVDLVFGGEAAVSTMDLVQVGSHGDAAVSVKKLLHPQIGDKKAPGISALATSSPDAGRGDGIEAAAGPDSCASAACINASVCCSMDSILAVVMAHNHSMKGFDSGTSPSMAVTGDRGLVTSDGVHDSVLGISASANDAGRGAGDGVETGMVGSNAAPVMSAGRDEFSASRGDGNGTGAGAESSAKFLNAPRIMSGTAHASITSSPPTAWNKNLV